MNSLNSCDQSQQNTTTNRGSGESNHYFELKNKAKNTHLDTFDEIKENKVAGDFIIEHNSNINFE